MMSEDVFLDTMAKKNNIYLLKIALFQISKLVG